MTKRIIAGVVGGLALLAAVDASFFAVRVSEDFNNPTVDFWFAVFGEIVVCAAAFVGFGIGMRFLHFACVGHSSSKPSWMRPMLISVGLFFPGFAFSLPLAFLFTTRIWKNPDFVIQISLGIGVICSVLAAVWQRKKGKADSSMS